MIFPNGLTSPNSDTDLNDASQVKQLRSGGFTYVLPAEISLLLVIVGVPAILLGRFLLRRFKRIRSKQGEGVSFSP